jgi:MarR family transcriptional regulator, negative regulator of the multidrug operon emrRAB
MLDRLCRQGIVTRARNPEDLRESIATISPAGLALLERVDPDIEQAQAELTSALSEPELRRLSRLCDALVP